MSHLFRQGSPDFSGTRVDEPPIEPPITLSTTRLRQSFPNIKNTQPWSSQLARWARLTWITYCLGKGSRTDGNPMDPIQPQDCNHCLSQQTVNTRLTGYFEHVLEGLARLANRFRQQNAHHASCRAFLIPLETSVFYLISGPNCQAMVPHRPIIT